MPKGLTVRFIETASRPGLYSDGGGLYLQVSQSGTKAWIFRFMLKGRARKMGLGPIDLVSLSDARQQAWEARRVLQDGRDPIAVRDEARKAADDEAKAAEAAVSQITTFREYAERYISSHQGSWRNPKHRQQWRSTLEAYVYPIIGETSVAEITTASVLKILEPIWSTKTETANRVRGRIESILDAAKVSEDRSGENPARWLGHLEHSLPARSEVQRVKHRAALPFGDLPAFMADLRGRDWQSARALEFLILTVARTGAVIGAVWSEIDLASRVWTVPAERVGTKIIGADGKPRRIPLSDRAMAILNSLPREDGNNHIFIGAKAGRPISNMAMIRTMREMRPGFVPHGFRSTFKDWSAETTNYPNEVSEAALWHVVADKTEAAYRRGDLFMKRIQLMADWSSYCASEIAPLGAKVFALPSAKTA